MNRMPAGHLQSVRRTPDNRALVRLIFVLACGALLTAGFVRATAQHVAAMRDGYRSEELRHERAKLLEEQQQLMVALDEASSPSRIARIAREIGMAPARARQIQPTQAAPVVDAEVKSQHKTAKLAAAE